MNKRIMIILITILLVIVSVYILNREVIPPDELLEYIKKTNGDEYWAYACTQNSLYILIHKQEYYKSISVGLLGKRKLKSYEQLMDNIFRVGIKDSRVENKVKSWIRIGKRGLIGPRINEMKPYTAYNIKDYFNPTTNKLAVSLDKIKEYNKMEEPFISGRKNYSAKYNLKGAKGGLPIPMEAYRGDLIILLNDNLTEMKEIYWSDEEWFFIRHVEKGSFPNDIDENDLNSILENIWWGWTNIIQPIDKQFETRMVQ